MLMENYLVSHHSCTGQSQFNDHSVTIQSPVSPHLVTSQSPFSYHSVTSQLPFCNYSVNIQLPVSQHSVTSQSPFSYPSVTTLLLFSPLKAQFSFCELVFYTYVNWQVMRPLNILWISALSKWRPFYIIFWVERSLSSAQVC